MAQLSLYFELLSKQLAGTADGPTGLELPPLRQEDNLNLEIGVIKRSSYVATPLFEAITLSGWSLTVSVGTANSVLAQQSSFTVDGTNKKFQGTLNLNTSGVNALTDNQEVYFEIKLSDGTGTYGQRFSVRIEKAVYLVGSPVPIAGDTALGVLEADRKYLKKTGGAGEGFVLKSADGLKEILIYCDNDGSFRAEPIT